MVLSALYYPHTIVRNKKFLKHALLYWDEIEFISPWDGFDPLMDYRTESARQLAQFLKPCTPTKEEKSLAHAEIMKLIDGNLPAWLTVDRVSSENEKQMYLMFENKLLPETWSELAKKKLIFRKHGDLTDYASHTYLGLTLMTVLARCCAGTLKHTITDRSESYGTFLKHLEFLSGVDQSGEGPLDPDSRKLFRTWLDVLKVERPRAEDAEREQLISITLDVINSSALSVASLVKLRTEKASFGSTLRRNYATAVEAYVDQLSEPSVSKRDAETLRDNFRATMETDMATLFGELSPVAGKAVLSKEMAIAVAAPLAGATILTSTGIGAPLGCAIAVGALSRIGVEYRAARDAVFSKHPMAFLYRSKRFQVF